MINNVLPDKQEGGFLAKYSLAQMLQGGGKKTRKISGQEKLKMSPYLSPLGRNLQKGGHTILAKLADGGQV